LMPLKIRATESKKATDVGSSLDEPVTVAALLERTMKEIKFLWETFLVADGSGSMYQDREHGVLICQAMV
jgi:hypothetical protein